MLKEVTASGKDVAEAKENARIALGAGELDDVKFEVLHAGSRGILGIIGVKPAKVRAYIDSADVTPAPRRADRGERTERNSDRRQGQDNRPKNNRPERKPRTGDRPAPAEKKPISDAAPKQRPADKAPRTPRSTVIPETQLKFEKRTVADGEDMSYEFVRTLVKNLGLDAEAELYSCEDGTRRINITGTDASLLIGHHGDTLDALQYLTNLAGVRKNASGERDKSRVTIDIEGYRAKREETLRALARRMAAKALRNKRSVMLEPMTAYERRIIHSEVQNIEGVSTNSIGSDNNRKIVIYLTDKKPEGLFEEPTKTPLAEEFAPSADEAVSVTDQVTASVNVDDEAATDSIAVRTLEDVEDGDASLAPVDGDAVTLESDILVEENKAEKSATEESAAEEPAEENA